MTQENKELLLQDLCGRLPYNVHVNYKGEIYGVLGISYGRLILCKPFMSQTLEYCPLVEEVKLCLFPLSSMTEEQKNQLTEIWDADMNKALDYAISGEEGLSDLFKLSAAKKVINWFIKNHFDYRGLIPKSLAIDATGLNIY